MIRLTVVERGGGQAPYELDLGEQTELRISGGVMTVEDGEIVLRPTGQLQEVAEQLREIADDDCENLAMRSWARSLVEKLGLWKAV